MSDVSTTLWRVGRIFRLARDNDIAFYHCELRTLPWFKVGAGWVMDMTNVPRKWLAWRCRYRFLSDGDWKTYTLSLWRLRLGYGYRIDVREPQLHADGN